MYNSTITDRQKTYMLAIAHDLNIRIPTSAFGSKANASAWLHNLVPIHQVLTHKRRGLMHPGEEHPHAKKGDIVRCIKAAKNHTTPIGEEWKADVLFPDGSIWGPPGLGILHPDEYEIVTPKEAKAPITKPLEVGQKVIIVSTTGHSFKMDEVVIIGRVTDSIGGIHATSEDRKKSQYLTRDNYELYNDTPDVLEENPDFSETKPSYEDILSGAYMKARSCKTARASASIAPKRSRSKPKAKADQAVS